MMSPTGLGMGANSGTAQAKVGSGSGLQGIAPDGRDAGDSQPTPAYQPKPTYPAFARRLGHEGRVVIRIQVLSSGAVAAASIERSSGYAVLDEAALATIKRWRFRPAQRAGQPVDATLNVPITFKLQEQG
ncbi:MAG: energy transducer TonB [Candidatus Contendobacter sp.]|nr:energy transducer TonB [Candidatus Contendobacter sp.]